MEGSPIQPHPNPRKGILSLSEDNIRVAAASLVSGGLVAFPTETVYGLGGDGLNPAALARIFEVKGRPRFDPLIIHIADMDSLEGVADLGALEGGARKKFHALAAQLWPGPLTLILPKQARVPSLATSGLPTVALRFPDHPAAQKLIRLSTGAVAAPSANPFGYLSPTRAEHVWEQLGNRIDYILDGGRTGIGVESTVLDLSAEPPRILRPGGTPQERIEAIIGPVLPGTDGVGSPLSPGQLISHYAPRITLTLHRREALIALPDQSSAGYLFFEGRSRDAWLLTQGNSSFPRSDSPEARIRALSETGSMAEAAANLFDVLHELDTLPISVIRAELVPLGGLGTAINDRLSRAGAYTQGQR